MMDPSTQLNVGFWHRSVPGSGTQPSPTRSVRFGFLSGHEQNLPGSEEYLRCGREVLMFVPVSHFG